jgi:hypothetical protein
MNVIGTHAAGNQLIAIGRSDVQSKLRPDRAAPRGRRVQEPPIDEMARMSRRHKYVNDVRSDLVATAADAWANRCHEIAGAGAKLLLHRFERRSSGAGGCAAPSRMNGRHHSSSAIGEQQRDTIGRPNRNSRFRIARDEHIGFRPGSRQRRTRCDDIRVAPVCLRRGYYMCGADCPAGAQPFVLGRQLELTSRKQV